MITCPHCRLEFDAPVDLAGRVEQMRGWCNENGRWVSADDRVAEATAAEILDRAPGTLRNWRADGQPPNFIRLRGRVTYRLDDLARVLGA